MRRLLALVVPFTLLPAAPAPAAGITVKVYGVRAGDTGAYAAACYTQTPAVATSIVLTCTVGDLSRTTKGAGRVLVSAVAGVPSVVPTQACGRVTATMIVSSKTGPILVTETQTSCVPFVVT